jgi:hypothetical protein
MAYTKSVGKIGRRSKMKATATEVKNRFGEFLERAGREPVEV